MMKFASLTAGSARWLTQKQIEGFLFEIYIVLPGRVQIFPSATGEQISLRLLFLLFLGLFGTIVIDVGFSKFLLLNDFRFELLKFLFLIVVRKFSFEDFDTIVSMYLIGQLVVLQSQSESLSLAINLKLWNFLCSIGVIVLGQRILSCARVKLLTVSVQLPRMISVYCILIHELIPI